jgi:hypothetical protein
MYPIWMRSLGRKHRQQTQQLESHPAHLDELARQTPLQHTTRSESISSTYSKGRPLPLMCTWVAQWILQQQQQQQP